MAVRREAKRKKYGCWLVATAKGRSLILERVGYITDKDGRRITLLEAMGDYGNVQKAYNKARKCKRHRKRRTDFTKDKEENLDKVREDIINLAYEPSKYHYFKVYEPKEAADNGAAVL